MTDGEAGTTTGLLSCKPQSTVERDLIATEMLAFPSKLSRNKNDSDPTIVIHEGGK